MDFSEGAQKHLSFLSALLRSSDLGCKRRGQVGSERVLTCFWNEYTKERPLGVYPYILGWDRGGHQTVEQESDDVMLYHSARIEILVIIWVYIHIRLKKMHSVRIIQFVQKRNIINLLNAVTGIILKLKGVE